MSALTTIAAPASSDEGDVTWTCTFNGRLDSLFAALESLMRETAVATQRRIRDWVVIVDSGASVADRVELVRRAPWLTVVMKGPALKRHPVSMNVLLDAFVKTQWWVQWEDDWAIPTGTLALNGCLIGRGLAVAEASGCQQVSLNGSFLDATTGYEVTDGGDHLIVALRPRDLADVLKGDPAACARVLAPRRAERDNPPPWPLFSLQPSVLQTAFVREAMYPFNTALDMCTAEAYWLWELEAAVRFVRAAGRKATLREGFATQLNVQSSSHSDDEPKQTIENPSSSSSSSSSSKKLKLRWKPAAKTPPD